MISASNFKNFWCHACRSQILLNANSSNLTCSRCRSELIEEIESFDRHPSQFVPQGLEPRFHFPANPQPIQFIQIITSVFAGGHRGAPPASNGDINSLDRIDGSGEDCPICQDPLSDDCRRMRCGHTYHFDCLQPWLRVHNTCPVCRIPLR